MDIGCNMQSGRDKIKNPTQFSGVTLLTWKDMIVYLFYYSIELIQIVVSLRYDYILYN